MKTKSSDYTKAEISKFNIMHVTLAAYNHSLGTNDELPPPNYPKNEIAELSRYCSILLDEKAKSR